MPRPDQMNINVATWGRLLKKNINLTKGGVGGDQQRLEGDPPSGRRFSSTGFEMGHKVVFNLWSSTGWKLTQPLQPMLCPLQNKMQ